MLKEQREPTDAELNAIRTPSVEEINRCAEAYLARSSKKEKKGK